MMIEGTDDDHRPAAQGANDDRNLKPEEPAGLKQNSDGNHHGREQPVKSNTQRRRG